MPAFLEHLAHLAASPHLQPADAADFDHAERDRIIVLVQSGLSAAARGAEAKLGHLEFCSGAVSPSCAVFDGLRVARRGVALALRDAREATTLTAAGIKALEDLDWQLGNAVASAQREMGAALSLRAAAEAQRASGLEGVGRLVGVLEAVAQTSKNVTQLPEDEAALRLARETRCLELEVRPLVEALDPMSSKRRDGAAKEVLWETRMVASAEVVEQACREARAEAGGWAVCSDAAAALRQGASSPADQSSSTAARAAAVAFDAAAARLCEGGLDSGVAALIAARCSQDIADGSPPELARLALRWLREHVGAAAVLREAESRVSSFERVEMPHAARVREKLAEAASSLEAGGLAAATAARPGGAAGAAFRCALLEAVFAPATAPSGASAEALQALLSEVERDVAQVLGVAWAAEDTWQAANRTAVVTDAPTETAPKAKDGANAVQNRQGSCCTIV